MCLMANSKNADVMGARIMRSLRAMSSQEINFFGYGGYLITLIAKQMDGEGRRFYERNGPQ